jgi:protein phosphatase
MYALVAYFCSYNIILFGLVGAEADVTPQVSRWQIEDDDIYLLCSDGVSNELSDDAMKTILEQHGPSEAAWRIINDALLAGGRDNATAVVIKVTGFTRP